MLQINLLFMPGDKIRMLFVSHRQLFLHEKRVGRRVYKKSGRFLNQKKIETVDTFCNLFIIVTEMFIKIKKRMFGLACSCLPVV